MDFKQSFDFALNEINLFGGVKKLLVTRTGPTDRFNSPILGPSLSVNIHNHPQSWTSPPKPLQAPQA
jgi:hypothetical protein